MKTIKVGMIGAGQISYDHCEAIRAHPRAEVVAATDISAKRLKLLKREFKIPRTYAKIKDLIADPDLDAITIALPNALHAETAIAALEAGKHVQLDKPFATSVAEAKAVLAAAKKAKKIFTLPMNFRYTREAQTIRELVKRGEFGPIYHAKAYWFRRRGIPKFGTWFCDKKRAGGGGLLDIGVHFLDCCLFIINNFKPVSVTGQTYTKFGNRKLGEGGWGMSDRGPHIFNVDDFGSALIKFENGATVSLDISWAMHRADPNKMDIEIFGPNAGASVYPARVYRDGKKKGEYEIVEPQGVEIPLPHCNRHHNWINTILGKEKQLTTWEQSLAVQKILSGIYESSRTGKEVRIR